MKPDRAPAQGTLAPGRRSILSRVTGSQRLLFLVFLLLGELFFFHRVLWSGLHQTAGDYVDHVLVNFICEHEFLWLIGRPDHVSLWDPPVYFPSRNVLVYAETFLAASPFYWPWRWAGLAPDTAYQLWLMTLPLLNFSAAYLLFRGGFRYQALPAFAGSFIAAFGNNLGAQVNNPQLHTVFYSYLGIYCLCRLFRAHRPQPGWAAGFVASFTAQLYACFYLGWFFLFFLCLAGLFMLITREHRTRLLAVLRANSLPLLVASLLAGLALSPLLVRALAAVRDLGWSNDVTVMLPRLRSWIYMGRRSLLYFWLDRTELFANLPGEPEQRLGLGLATMICAALGLRQSWKNPWIRLLVALAAAVVILTTEVPGGRALWYGIRMLVPGARALRCVSRVGVLLLLPAGVGVSAFLATRRWSRVTLAAAGLCLAEQAYSEYTFSKDSTRTAVAHYVAAIDPRCKSFYMAVKQDPGGGDPHWVYQAEIMWAQLNSRIPTVNGGYTRFEPPGYGSLGRNVVRTREDIERLKRDLLSWRLRHGLREEEICWTEVTAPH